MKISSVSSSVFLIIILSFYSHFSMAIDEMYKPEEGGVMPSHQKVIELIFGGDDISVSTTSTGSGSQIDRAFKVIENASEEVAYFVKVVREDQAAGYSESYEWQLKNAVSKSPGLPGLKFVYPIAGANYSLEGVEYRMTVYPFIKSPSLLDIVFDYEEGKDKSRAALQKAFERFGQSVAYLNHGAGQEETDIDGIPHIPFEDRHPGNVLYNAARDKIYFIDLDIKTDSKDLSIKRQLVDTFESWFLSIKHNRLRCGKECINVIYPGFRDGYLSGIKKKSVRDSMWYYLDLTMRSTAYISCRERLLIACDVYEKMSGEW